MNIEEIEGMLEEVSKKIEENSFALDTLRFFKKIIIILIFALVGTNLAWLIYFSQFETVSEETTEQKIVQEQQDTESSTMSGVIN